MNKVFYHFDRCNSLIQTPAGFFCVSPFSLNVVRINAPLFNRLKQIESGQELEADSVGTQEREILEQLVFKGVLRRREVFEQAEWPSVSVIIPVRNRVSDLRECLETLASVDYPRDKLEILVVDDGSSEDVLGGIQSFSVKTHRMKISIGQSACRNYAARQSNGEILAFLDSDCTVTPSWLKELVPFLIRPEIGAVGGYIEGYYDRTLLDRYEKACSPLCMGQHEQGAGADPSPLYVPSCNLLVAKDIFFHLEGFREDFRVGEDVDFCWRLREYGRILLYRLNGKVYHKHRNRLPAMLKRRFDYGTSEAPLLVHHPNKSKKMDLSLRDRVLFITVCLFFFAFSWWTLIPIFLTLCWDFLQKCLLIRRKNIPSFSTLSVLRSTIRWSFFSLHKISYFAVRYYLLLLIFLGIFSPSLFFLNAVLFSIAVAGIRLSKREDLSLLPFSFYFFLEQIAYQLGVIKGCIQAENWRPFCLQVTLPPKKGKLVATKIKTGSWKFLNRFFKIIEAKDHI